MYDLLKPYQREAQSRQRTQCSSIVVVCFGDSQARQWTRGQMQEEFPATQECEAMKGSLRTGKGLLKTHKQRFSRGSAFTDFRRDLERISCEAYTSQWHRVL